MKTTQVLLAAVAAAVFAGCVQHGYVDPTRENFDRPDSATLYDMKTVVAQLVSKLQADETFQAHYDKRLAKLKDLPVLQIGGFQAVTKPGERVTRKLDSARSRLEFALRQTELFDIVDDAAAPESFSEELAESMTINADIGLKKGANLQAFGEHADADYQMYGIYRETEDGGRYTYSLELRLIDLHNGKIVWSDIGEVEKK